jgi:hypothetical protein
MVKITDLGMLHVKYLLTAYKISASEIGSRHMQASTLVHWFTTLGIQVEMCEPQVIHSFFIVLCPDKI